MLSPMPRKCRQFMISSIFWLENDRPTKYGKEKNSVFNFPLAVYFGLHPENFMPCVHCRTSCLVMAPVA